METEFVWQDEFNLGVASIDRDHQRLFHIINKLFVFREEADNIQWACQEGIKFFKTHAMKHFADEESYMASIGYEDLEAHRHIHQGFREVTLPALEEELERTNYAPDAMDHFLGVCAGWLIGHTLTEDLAITGKPMGKWEELLPEEELAAMKRVIVKLVFDLFHLESQCISDAYGGERFGTGIYYRLVYGTAQAKQQEILMVFEEKLLINTVGKVLGLQTNKLESTLLHAARYTAQQFVGRIMEHFPAMEGYVLKEENLLSYDQFQTIFAREKLQVSLLFNTGGAGYFAYCSIAPHLLQEGVGTPIEKDTAMAQVEQYLMERDAALAKPKILVVDDSMTIRQGMKDLLETDYEVDLAASGVAAIRSMTLNRPDLLLLDYQMPVCDGRQTLEMLRSEASFADIPVIFLTGASDPGVVAQLLSLKPAGYLLKTLRLSEIKQKIDAFFQQAKSCPCQT
ncbi:MAG: response regulator [Oscillospiraceae bacterium]|nr:response regulator [Oscillospiraceae bacterium]